MVQTLFQNPLKQSLSKYTDIVKEINGLEKTIEKLSKEEMRERTKALKLHLSKSEINDGLIIEAFALVREATRRVLGIRHFDVQLIGGLILNEGKIAK
jgi:preprotein translocase subunit SecA